MLERTGYTLVLYSKPNYTAYTYKYFTIAKEEPDYYKESPTQISYQNLEKTGTTIKRKIYIISRRMIYFTMIFVRKILWAKSFEKKNRKQM